MAPMASPYRNEDGNAGVGEDGEQFVEMGGEQEDAGRAGDGAGGQLAVDRFGYGGLPGEGAGDEGHEPVTGGEGGELRPVNGRSAQFGQGPRGTRRPGAGEEQPQGRIAAAKRGQRPT
jgi:hypothetical protein